MRSARPRTAVLLASACLAAVCWAQEQPLSLGGRLYSGFFSTTSRNGSQNSLSFVPVGVDLNLAGYLGAPGLLQYRVEPHLTSGPQASEAGLMGGNGVTLSTTFLGGRSFPLKLNYTNMRREDVFFGGIAQVSGFRSRNHERSLGLGWELRARGLPEVYIDYGTSSLDAAPDIAILPEYRSQNRNIGVQIKHEIKGWQLTSEVRRAKLANTFAASSDLRVVDLHQNNSVAQAGATRALWAGSRLTFNGGVTKYRSTLDDRSQSQSNRFGTGSLSFGEGRRLRGDLRSTYTSNLLGTQIQRLLTGAEAGFGPEALILFPLSARISHLSNAGGTRFELLQGLSIFGSVNHDRVRAPETGFTAPNSDYLSGTGGVSVNRQLAWLNLGGQYSETLGRTAYRRLRGRMDGRNFSASARAGRVERLEVSGSYSQFRQRTRQVIHTEGGGKSVTLSLARRLGLLGLELRAGAGYDRSYFRDENQHYRANGLSFNGSLQHRLAQASYARNATDGRLLLAFLAGPLQSPLLIGSPLAAVLSTFRTDTLTFHATPVSKLEFNLLWTRSRQAFAQQLTNRFEQFDVSAGYRFRLLTLDCGYVIYDQTLLGILPFHRDRLYVRVSRNFRVL